MKDANQGLAVNFEHADIIVAAGAGTGKTESMTNRVVRKVTEGMSIRNILVLTFTNAAAAEMKGRIEAKLRDAAYAEKNPDEKLRLLSETLLVDRAHIQTFHSFCVDIIREYHHFIELSPDFRVLSESERKLLLDEAFDRVFQKAADLCPLAYEWYAQIDRAGKPRQFKELTLKLLELAENAVDFEVALRDFNAYRADKLEILIQINEELIPDLEKQVEREIAVFERFVEDSPIAGNSGLRAEGDLLLIPDKNGKWKEMKSPRRVASETLEKIRDRFDAVKKGGDAPYRRTPLKSVPEEVYLGQEIFGMPVDAQEDYKIIADRVHDSVKKAIADLQERKSFAQGGVIPHRELFERYFEDLAHFVLLVRKSFVESKAERNVIDFGDQEHKAFELLEKEAVRDSVRSRFEAVFVDENQDSSEIQDRIVHHAVGGTLYRVGDVKQCIYAFRSAEPKIFQHYIEHDAVLYDAYASELPSEPELAEARRVVIPLNTNFRTVQPILDFVNLIFRHEMASLYKGAELISFRTIEAQSASASPNGDATAPNANAEENSAVRNPVRVLRYEGKEALALKRESHSPDDSLGGEGDDDADGHEGGPERSDIRNIELEADIVAREIKQLVESGEAYYRDCAVLLRSLAGRGGAFRYAFRRHGIPLEVQAEGNMLDLYEVATLVSSIRGILNPYRDADFVSLLISPFFEFTAEEMRTLSDKLSRRTDCYYTLFLLVFSAYRDLPEFSAALRDGDAEGFAVPLRTGLDADHDADLEMGFDADLDADFAWEADEDNRIDLHDLPKDLIVKMLHTYRKVNWLRGYSHYLPPAEFIWKLYDFNNFFDKIGNLPDGTERQDMLKTFVENVRNEGTGLEEVLQKEEMKLPNNLSEERDAVKLMTTHSSKGMGFPHVFLCNLDGYINDQDARGRVIKTDFGVAVSYLVDAEGRLCENEVYELAQERARRLNLEEEKRVLYVAMTRAKKSLTLLTAVAGSSANDGELFVPKSDREKKRYIDMIEPYIGDYIESYDTESVVRDLVAWKQSRSAYAHAGSTGLQREEDLEISMTDGLLSDALPEQDAASSLSSSSSSSDIAFVPYFAQETLAKAKRPSFAENMYALTMGTEAHRELERFDFRSLLEMSEEEIENAQFSKRKVVNRFLKSAFARRIACADEIYKEADFVDDTGSGKLQGIIDLFFIEDGKIILVDYKTDVYREERVFDSDVAPGAAPDSAPNAENDAKKVSLEEIVKRYKPQLKRYKEVLERVYEKEVSEVYLYLLHGQGRLVALSFE